MVPIFVKITEVNWWPGASAKEKRDVLTKALYAMAEDYWLHYIPEHFKRSAYSRYGYRPRQGERGSGIGPGDKGYKSTYMWRKFQKWHHRNPLEWSGATKRSAIQVRGVNANSARSWLVAYTPNLNRKPWCWEEYKRVTQPEKVGSIRKGELKLIELMRRYKKTTRIIMNGGV